MKKLLQTLKLIKEIKSLNKNDFHVFRVDVDTDCETMCLLSEYLDEKHINHIVIKSGFSVKSFAARDKKELLEYIKKEIGLED